MSSKKRFKGYAKPIYESAIMREQMIIHLWENLKIKYGEFFDKITKKERIVKIQDHIGLSESRIGIIINAYIRGEIKYRPEIFDSGESEAFTRI